MFKALLATASVLVSAQVALADAAAVRQCQAECIAAFERPSALQRQCVSNCVKLAEQPARPANSTPAQPK